MDEILENVKKLNRLSRGLNGLMDELNRWRAGKKRGRVNLWMDELTEEWTDAR